MKKSMKKKIEKFVKMIVKINTYYGVDMNKPRFLECLADNIFFEIGVIVPSEELNEILKKELRKS